MNLIHITHLLFLFFLLPTLTICNDPTCGSNTGLLLQGNASYIQVCRCPRDQPPVFARISTLVPISNNRIPPINEVFATLRCFSDRNTVFARACDDGIEAYNRASENANAECIGQGLALDDESVSSILMSENCQSELFTLNTGTGVIALYGRVTARLRR